MATAAPSNSSQHYCLRWNNYQSNLTSVFDQLLQNESFVDVTLAVAGHTVRAHKVILSASSPYFQSLLRDNPCQHPIIVIDDVTYADIQAVVQFMYKGEIHVAEQQLPSLLKVAETLRIRGLADVPDGAPTENGHGPATSAASASKQGRATSTEATPPPAFGGAPTPPTGLENNSEMTVTRTEAPSGGTGSPSAWPARAAPSAGRGAEEAEIRPAIAEMIKEEERAKIMESTASWGTPPEATFQHQLQQAWQKSWNQQQSLLQNLRFRERGPLKSWRPETMAAAIMSVLREGHSLSQAARTYDIPYPTFVLYANRVHNLLGPSQEGPGGIPNDLRPKGRGRPQRILLGTWPEETVNNVIRAVVFRDTSGLKEQMETKAAAVAAAAAAAGHPLNHDVTGPPSKMMMHHHQLNGRPPYSLPMPRGHHPSLGQHHTRGHTPTSQGAGRPRHPSMLGFPDMQRMMGLFPPGMMSQTGAVPTINLPPLVDQKPVIQPPPRSTASPASRPAPGLSRPSTGSDSGDADMAGDADAAALLEPVQEMIEGAPLETRRDSGDTENVGGGRASQEQQQQQDAAKVKTPEWGRGASFHAQAAALAGQLARARPPMAAPQHHANGAAPRPRHPSVLGFPDMQAMMGLFPPGMMSQTGAVPTINLPPPMDQKPVIQPPPRSTASPASRQAPGLSRPSTGSDSGDADMAGDADAAALLEPVQEMIEGAPLETRRDSGDTENVGGGRASQEQNQEADKAKAPEWGRGASLGASFHAQAAALAGQLARARPPMAAPQHHANGAAPRPRHPSVLGFPDMQAMGGFPPGMLSDSGAVPTINLPPLDQQQQQPATSSPVMLRPEVSITPIISAAPVTMPAESGDAARTAHDSANMLEPLQEMTTGLPMETNKDCAQRHHADTTLKNSVSSSMGAGGAVSSPLLYRSAAEDVSFSRPDLMGVTSGVETDRRSTPPEMVSVTMSPTVLQAGL